MLFLPQFYSVWLLSGGTPILSAIKKGINDIFQYRVIDFFSCSRTEKHENTRNKTDANLAR